MIVRGSEYRQKRVGVGGASKIDKFLNLKLKIRRELSSNAATT